MINEEIKQEINDLILMKKYDTILTIHENIERTYCVTIIKYNNKHFIKTIDYGEIDEITITPITNEECRNITDYYYDLSRCNFEFLYEDFIYPNKNHYEEYENRNWYFVKSMNEHDNREGMFIIERNDDWFYAEWNINHTNYDIIEITKENKDNILNSYYKMLDKICDFRFSIIKIYGGEK